jgi:hypothetical protein
MEVQNVLVEYRVHFPRGFVLRAGLNVGIGVEEDGKVGVSQRFLNHLGKDRSGEYYRGAGVLWVVEADLGKACALEERVEGSGDEVVAIRGMPTCVVKIAPYSCQSPSSRCFSLSWRSRCHFKASTATAVSVTPRFTLAVLGTPKMGLPFFDSKMVRRTCHVPPSSPRPPTCAHPTRESYPTRLKNSLEVNEH